MLDALYLEVAAAAREDEATWEQRAHAVVAPFASRWGDAFLAWAKEDDRWRLTVAEAATRVCAKPREAAAFIVVEGLRERLVDEGVIDDED